MTAPDRPRHLPHAVRARLVPLLAIALLLPAATTSRSADGPRSVTWPMRTMGTYANVTIVTADSAAAAPLAAIAQKALARVDSLMTNWTTTSEVARINREAGAATVTVHPEVARVIDKSLAVGLATRGAFDITVEPLVRLWGFLGGPRRVPSAAEIDSVLPRVGMRHVVFDPHERTLHYDRPDVHIDLGGIAKGYGVETAADSFAAHGVRDALIDLSGNMHAFGHPPGAPYWRIGIRDPHDQLAYFARLGLTNQSISTSGQYEQFIAANGRTYGHILDPKTGWPVQGLISVTLVATSAFDTDAWDTPLFVLGPARARAIAKANDDIAAILVAPGAGVDTVWVEESLRDRFELVPEAQSRFVVRWF
jgi:thiamine biosynthesis lipoprotein